jgi:DNA gyrase subunit A
MPPRAGHSFIPAEGEFRMEDLIANEGCIITVYAQGLYQAHTGQQLPFAQKRGGKGVIGASYATRRTSPSISSPPATHDYMMFFMNNGRVYVQKVYDIPEGTRVSKGRSIEKRPRDCRSDERLAAMIPIKEFTDELHLVMATNKGVVKKTNLNDYRNFRRGGLIGINIDEGDALIGVKLTGGENELVMITRKGMSIRFSENDLRDQGRATRGVRGIKLKGEDDAVITIEVVNPEETLLIAGMNGQGKRTNFEEYRLQSRGGSGVIAMKTKGVAGALSVAENDEIMLLTYSGQAVRTRVNEVRVIGRTTQGVRLINLKDKDHLIGMSKVIEVDEEEA